VIGMQEPQTVAAAPARRLDPAREKALLERVDALAEVPAGPELAAALAAVDCDELAGQALVGLMRARDRQANHARGELLATVGRVMLDDVSRTEVAWPDPAWVAVDEVRASLRLTRSAAGRLCALAWDLTERLPLVLAGMRGGMLDQPRAQVFSSWTSDLAEYT
jgi:hypothetical protein